MNQIDAPNPGQAWARTRWNSHGSGAAFDRKKQPYLAPEMKVFAGQWEKTEGSLALEVTQSVFHCAKYIDQSYEITRFASRRPRTFKPAEFMMAAKQGRLIHQLVDFLADQRVAFVCTVDRNGQCAVNHRGGGCGFISVNGVQDEARVLLPDYAGNGAFEPAGNIWETRRAAVFVPDSENSYGVCVSGPAELFHGEVLQTEPFVRLSGAQRVLAIHPLCCQVQSWKRRPRTRGGGAGTSCMWR